MQFFENIEPLLKSFDFKISITKSGDKIVVGLFPEHKNEEVTERLKPLNLEGTAAELDEGFFKHITPTIETAAGLANSIDGYNTELKKLEGEKKTAVEKKAQDKSKKPTEKPVATVKQKEKPRPEIKAESAKSSELVPAEKEAAPEEQKQKPIF